MFHFLYPCIKWKIPVKIYTSKEKKLYQIIESDPRKSNLHFTVSGNIPKKRHKYSARSIFVQCFFFHSHFAMFIFCSCSFVNLMQSNRLATLQFFTQNMTTSPKCAKIVATTRSFFFCFIIVHLFLFQAFVSYLKKKLPAIIKSRARQFLWQISNWIENWLHWIRWKFVNNYANGYIWKCLEIMFDLRHAKACVRARASEQCEYWRGDKQRFKWIQTGELIRLQLNLL